MSTMKSNSDANLTAIQAYLAGDLDGVQSAYEPVVTLMSHLYEGIEMPSSECSPCFGAESTETSLANTIYQLTIS